MVKYYAQRVLRDPYPHILQGTGDTTGDLGNKIFTVRENGSLLLAVAGEKAIEQSIL